MQSASKEIIKSSFEHLACINYNLETEIGKKVLESLQWNKNLEKNGWGTQGAVGADRSDYTKASGRGDKVNLISL